MVPVSGSSLLVSMPLSVAAVVTSPVEVLVISLKFFAMSLHTTVSSLPLEVMAIFFVGVAFLLDAVVCT